MRNPALLALLFLLAPTLAAAAPADVIGVEVTRASSGSYSFTVTVRSDDTGWDKYADRWEILAPDGRVLGTRELLHPHETEQPFTRSLSGVTIPRGVSEVHIRAHDKVEGFGGAELTIPLP